MAELERTDKPASLLVKELKSGVLGVPEIQRDYVWKTQQAIDLLDSMYRKYPIGLILLWKPSSLPLLRNYKDGKRIPDYLILDGQQRITTLEKIFSGEINIAFNVKTEVFQKANGNLNIAAYWVSLKEVIDDTFKVLSQLDKSLNLSNDEKSGFFKKLERLKNIQDYIFPVMIMNTDDYEEITESFIRLNSKGTRLRKTELAMAQLAFRWPGAIIDKFSTAINEFNEVGFELETSFFMRCFIAIIRQNSSAFGNLESIWSLNESELDEYWKATKTSLQQAINFLKNNAGIESSSLLSQEMILIPLTYFFYKKHSQRVSDREINGLLLWFFITLVFGRYSGKVSEIDRDIKDINTSDPIKSLLDNLRRGLSSFTITPEIIKGTYNNNKFLPLLFVIIKNKSASDWFSGINLSSASIGGKNKIQKHHIFPKNFLKDFNFDSRLVNDLANISFITQHANLDILDQNPSLYLNKIELRRLEDQFVPTYKELWKGERFEDFCNERRKLIANAINEYFSALLDRV